MFASEKSQKITRFLVIIFVCLILGASVYLFVKSGLVNGDGLNGDSTGAHQRQDEISQGNLQDKCEEYGGQWIEDYTECENIEAERCEELGGSYDECASACRHDADADMCIQLCVEVCKF
jgi:hypothetical protein